MCTVARMTIPEVPLARLQQDAADALRRWDTGTDAERTEALRTVAESFVAARQHFFNKDGAADLLGRSFAYRTWVRETMTLGGVEPSRSSTVMAAIRYHSGNVLREWLSAAQLESIGARKESPRQRSAEVRGRTSETAALLTGNRRIDTPEEVLALATAATAALGRVSPEAISGRAKDRRAAREALAGLAAAAQSLVG